MSGSQAIYETQILLTSQQYYQWKGILFSFQWWILLFLFITSWVIWWRLVQKSKVFEVLSYALMVVIIGTTLDIYGVKLGLWAYPIKTFYLNPGLLAGDFALPPVVKSLIYQYYPDWKRFIIAQIIVSACFSFLCEPILHWVGVYEMYRWSYFSSFLVYIPVAVLTKLIVYIMKKQTLSDSI